MKAFLVYLFISILSVSPLSVQSQITKADNSISFSDYGPIAFEGFWSIPDDPFNEHSVLRLSSRISTNHKNRNYFTQYFRSDIPLGCDHFLSVRMPLHYFNIDKPIAQSLEMKNNSGVEFGDIDIIFNIKLLKEFLNNKTNNRLHIYVSGEMHTAPTGRENRQFTDVIKLLGTLRSSYLILYSETHSLNGILCIGGGGWDDLEAPFQKHALKISSKLSYESTLRKNNRTGIFVGGTYLNAEGDNNEGLLLKSGFSYFTNSGIRLGINFGIMNYTHISNSSIYQYEFSGTLPLVFNKK